MKILLAIPLWRSGVYSETMESLFNLDRGGHEVEMFISEGFLTFEARNNAVNKAKQVMADYIFWVDSDMVIPKDALVKLMKLMDTYEVASGVYYKRRPPCIPLIYEKGKNGIFINIPIVKEGIQEVGGVGFGCVLTKMSAFDGMEEPFSFRKVEGIWQSEDLIFCEKLTEAGKKIAVDTSIQCGHLTVAEITNKHWHNFKQIEDLEGFVKKLGGEYGKV
jgi:hypothetical protein